MLSPLHAFQCPRNRMLTCTGQVLTELCNYTYIMPNNISHCSTLWQILLSLLQSSVVTFCPIRYVTETKHSWKIVVSYWKLFYGRCRKLGYLLLVSRWCKSLSQPARDVFERSQSDLYWERHLRDLLETPQKRWVFCDVFKTSQGISKKISTPRSLWDVSKTSLESICDFLKLPHKNSFVWFPYGYYNIW